MNVRGHSSGLRLFRKDASVASATLRKADTFFGRLRGLLGQSGLPADEVLWIVPCTSVHTFFMRFPIDVAFIDDEGTIVRLVEHLGSGRLAFAGRARSVLEFAAGSAVRLGLAAGEQLEWSAALGAGRSPLTAGSLRS